MNGNLDPLGASRISRVRNANDRFMADYANRESVCLLGDAERLTPNRKALVLGYAQPWSDAYQRMLMARCLLETDASLRRMSEIHMAEELGHHLDLSEERGSTPVLWDPVIAACGSWIVDAMATFTQIGRLALVHFVLECSSLATSTAGLMTFDDSRYFALHSELDEDHVAMGFDELSRRHDWEEAEILETLSRGWDVVSTFIDRCVHLVMQQELSVS